jgi:hypothetical protein
LTSLKLIDKNKFNFGEELRKQKGGEKIKIYRYLKGGKYDEE